MSTEEPLKDVTVKESTMEESIEMKDIKEPEKNKDKSAKQKDKKEDKSKEKSKDESKSKKTKHKSKKKKTRRSRSRSRSTDSNGSSSSSESSHSRDHSKHKAKKSKHKRSKSGSSSSEKSSSESDSSKRGKKDKKSKKKKSSRRHSKRKRNNRSVSRSTSDSLRGSSNGYHGSAYARNGHDGRSYLDGAMTRYGGSRRFGGYNTGRGMDRERENPPPNNVLGCFGLSQNTDERTLRQTFQDFGRIDKVTLIMDRKTGASKGYAFIYFESERDATAAKEACAGIILDGRKIRIDYSLTSKAHTPTPGTYLGYRSIDKHRRRDSRSKSRSGSKSRSRSRSKSSSKSGSRSNK